MEMIEVGPGECHLVLSADVLVQLKDHLKGRHIGRARYGFEVKKPIERRETWSKLLVAGHILEVTLRMRASTLRHDDEDKEPAISAFVHRHNAWRFHGCRRD